MRHPHPSLPVTVAIAAALLVLTPASADEPPSWRGFEARSKSGDWVAVVEPDAGGPADRTKKSWTLTVYLEQEKPDGTTVRTKEWSCPYAYGGYPGALVSDDGKSVAYVEVWWREKGTAVSLYHDGKHVADVKGADIPFDRTKMQATVSHHLWLVDGGATYGRSAEFDAKGRLIVRTVDGKEHRFDPATGKRLE